MTAELAAIVIAAMIVVLSLFLKRKGRRSHPNEMPPDSPSTFPLNSYPLPDSPRTTLLPVGPNTVEVSRVCKSYGAKAIVDCVSFEVKAGEIFGMVGPNGAGKTTTIRMLMDIIKPDSGGVRILGEPFTEATKNRIGYLPEERGLYRKITVSECLNYLAQLKGLDSPSAGSRTEALLRRMGMLAHKDKKIEQLSRGMGQLIQFATAVVHDPELLILDEPFSGLDPVNKEAIKQFLRELRARGKSVILSAHQMNEVEELCDRILMIHRGQAVLYGNLDEIKNRFRNNSVYLEYEGSLEGLEGIAEVKDRGRYVELLLESSFTPQALLAQLISRGVKVGRFEVATPSLNDIFIQMVKGQ